MAGNARNPHPSALTVALKESDNRFTSPPLIAAIEYGFGKVDFDPCWHPASAVRPRAYLDVRRGDDGLCDAWSGRLAFVNPPWSNQKKWIERAHDQWSSGKVETIVCLVPAKTDTRLFHEVLSKDADVYFIEGRPRFFKEDGSSEATMVSTMMVIFGATSDQKQRFAQRVSGSWWLPNRPSTDFAGRSLAGGSCAVTAYPVMTCAVSSRARVLCAPAC